LSAYWTNHGKADVMSGGISGRQFRLVLVTSAPASAGVAADLNVTADITADECTFTNYARQTLASVAVTEDDTNDWAKLAASDPSTYTAAGGATNNTIVGAWVVRRITTGSDTDASDILWCFLGLPSGQPTNGGDINLHFGANGISTGA